MVTERGDRNKKKSDLSPFAFLAFQEKMWRFHLQGRITTMRGGQEAHGRQPLSSLYS